MAASSRPRREPWYLIACRSVDRTSLLRDRDFRLVLGGQGVSAFGDAITMTALPLMVVALTGSGVAMGVVGVLQTLPDLLLGLPAGALADRWDRRRLIIAADLGRAALTALVPISVMLGWNTMAVILLVTFPINAMRVLFLAAWTSSMPSLAGRDRVGRAQGYVEAIFGLSYVLGPAIAGILVATIGAGPTLVIDAATFVGSALAMLLVRRPLQADRGPTDTHFLAEILEGLRYLAHEPTLRVAVSFWTLVNVTLAPLVAGVIFFMTIERGAPAGVVGLTIAGYGAGYLVGALLAGRFSGGPLGRIMLVANAGIAVTLVVFVATDLALLRAAMTFVTGTLGALTLIPYITLRSTIPPDRLLGRVSATARTLSMGLTPVGLFLGGIALDTLGGAETIVGIGLLAGSLSVVFAASAQLRAARVPPVLGSVAPEPSS
jgi:predicted MFS family arabinose efflux permease